MVDTLNKKTPQILSLAAKRVGEWQTHQWKWLYRIRHNLVSRYHNKKRLTTRSLRIDQRVAIQAVLKVIIQHIDLSSMCVGYYHKQTGAFIHLGLNYIANRAGINHRRAQRAIKWLYESGYISQFKQSYFDEELQEYVHKPALRRVHPKMFLDLGITQLALSSARRRSRSRLNKQRLAALPKIPFNKSVTSPQPTATSNTNQGQQGISNKDYLDKIKKLMVALPDLSFDEAKSLLPSSY